MTAGHRAFIFASYRSRRNRRRDSMTKRIFLLCTLGAVCATAVAATALARQARSQHESGTPPMPPAASFSNRIDNQWFPLRPGARYVYTGVKDGKPSRDVVTV